MLEEEKKVIIRLQKQDLASDRKEKKDKRRRQWLLASLALLLIWVGFSIGYLLPSRGHISQTSQALTQDKKLDTLIEYLSSLWLYKDNYQDINTTLQDKAYYGATTFEEDPYTGYLSAEELETFSSGINMNFVGIGVSYFQNAGVSTITQVFKGSPAEKAGLQVGDVLLMVDGMAIGEKTSEEIRELVIGEEGTQVNIRVRREGKEIDIPIIRGRVDTTAYAELKGEIVYLHIYSFGENTYREVMRYLDEYQHYHSLVIDLRDNGGGYQTAVENIAGLFLPKGTVMMRQVYADGQEASFETSSTKYYDNFTNIVVLINQNTASASEVLAMALREKHPNTLLFGTKSYGKGVVQTTFPLRDGSAIKLTTSKWLSPNGVWIDKKGIEPDVEVLLEDALIRTYEKFPEEDVYKLDQVSSFVASASSALQFLDYPVDRVDGYLSASVMENLRKFQADKGLKESGELDKTTYESLVSSVYRIWNLQKEKDTQLQAALTHLSK